MGNKRRSPLSRERVLQAALALADRDGLDGLTMRKLGYVLARGAFGALSKKMDPRNSNGGVFLGLNGIVIKSHGNTDAEALITAAKGLKWDSPRGPMSIDPDTRDVVQTIYIRRVEKAGGELVNVPFDKIENVKDPTRARGG